VVETYLKIDGILSFRVYNTTHKVFVFNVALCPLLTLFNGKSKKIECLRNLKKFLN
jgi:hypothetical protein